MSPFWKRTKSDARQSQSQSHLQSQVQSQTQPQSQPRIHELPDDPLPQIENPFLKRGDELFNEGDYQSAIFMYNEALRQKDSVLLHLKIALSRTLIVPAQWEAALLNVNSAIEIDPSSGQAWKQKGDICIGKGDFRAAEEALIHATTMLQGLDRLQAQNSLAEARSRQVTQTPISPPSTTAMSPSPSSVITPPVSPPPATTVELPVRSQPQTTSSVPSSSVPISSPPANSSPPPPSLSPQVPAVGLAAPSNSAPIRSPSPNIQAQAHVLAEQLDIPTEAPPLYTAIPRLNTGLGNNSANIVNRESQLVNLENTLATRRQGSLYLTPFTAEGQVDSIQLMFQGKTLVDSVVLDLAPQIQSHPTWKKYHVDAISYPGTTFIDHDCESTSSYDGNHHGVTSVLGYTEEYRLYQLGLKPPFEIFFEAQTFPPVMEMNKIVERIQLLQRQPDLEDNTKLSEILGLSATAQNYGVTRTTSIQDICMVFHRGQFDCPSRFIDLLIGGTLTHHVFGVGGIGLRNFLFLILLGAELYIRLRKAGEGVRYPNMMKPTTSALVVIAQQWMENVTIRVIPQPNGLPARHTLVANNHTRQAEGLIRLAEALVWPYLDEARQYLENAYNNLIANPANVDHYLKDWLYGLSLPGKYFRHLVMTCLILACPTTKHIGPAPYYDNGVVVGNKSYWPKRSILGRVLGALRNPKTTCGWVGPVPAPVGFQTGWILLSARPVDFATPVVDDLRDSDLAVLGFSDADAIADPQGLVSSLLDLSKWDPPATLPARTGGSSSTGQTSAVRLEAIRLIEVTVPGVSAAIKYHRAILDFTCHGERVTFTLYSNPVFVHVPRCVGAAHPIYERQVQQHFANIVLAKDLKRGGILPSTDALTIIDATEPGEEAMARAWCAESGRHAVVRKNNIGCFSCATTLAAKRTGLGFGVLIWCR